MWIDNFGANQNENIDIKILLKLINSMKEEIANLRRDLSKNKWEKTKWTKDKINKNEELYAKIAYRHPWDGDHFTQEEKEKYDFIWEWHGTIIPLSPKEWNDAGKIRDAILYMEKNQQELTHILQFPWWVASQEFAIRRLEHNNDDLIAYRARLAEIELL